MTIKLNIKKKKLSWKRSVSAKFAENSQKKREEEKKGKPKSIKGGVVQLLIFFFALLLNFNGHREKLFATSRLFYSVHLTRFMFIPQCITVCHCT